MMIDRINALMLKAHLPKVHPYGGKYPTPHHDMLDTLDRHVGIITRFKLNGELSQVGERVRRLERHTTLSETPPYFWLGAEADTLALPG